MFSGKRIFSHDLFMKLTWTIFAFFLYWVPARAQNETELIKKVKAKLDKINDYQAIGKMKIDVSFMNVPESKVTIYYKKPDKFKVVKEGGISLLPKGGVGINVNSLLMDPNYSVVPAGNAIMDGVPIRVIKMLPSDENS